MAFHIIARVGFVLVGGAIATFVANKIMWKIENDRLLNAAHLAMDEGRFADAHGLLQELEERLMAAGGERAHMA